MPVKQRRRIVRSARRLGLGTLAALAALALLAPSLTPLIGDELAAYRPDHGHLVAGDVVPPHAHPYEDHHASHARAEGAATLTQFGAMDLGAAGRLLASAAPHEAASGEPDQREIVFTHGGDGAPGSTSAPALPGGASVAASIAGWPRLALAAEPHGRPSLALLVPVPPPRA